MKRTLFSLNLVLLIAILPGCAFREEKSATPSGPKDGEAGTRVALITPGFEEIRTKILALQGDPKACLNCHSNAKSPELGDYASVYAERERIRKAVFDSSASAPMPPRRLGKLSADQLSLLKAWLDAGAPEVAKSNAASGATPTPPETTPANASATGTTPSTSASGTGNQPTTLQPPAPLAGEVVTWKTMQDFGLKKCLGCHSGTEPDAGLDLTHYTATKKRINNILKAVLVDDRMPPPPDDIQDGHPNPNALTHQEKSAISEWVIEGMRLDEASAGTPPAQPPTQPPVTTPAPTHPVVPAPVLPPADLPKVAPKPPVKAIKTPPKKAAPPKKLVKKTKTKSKK